MQVVVALSLVSLCSLSPLLPALDWMPSMLQVVTGPIGGLDNISPAVAGFEISSILASILYFWKTVCSLPFLAAKAAQ